MSRIKKVFSSAVKMKILGNKQLEPVLPFKCGLVANVASHLSTFHYFSQLRKSTKAGGSTCIFKLRPLNFFTQSRTDMIQKKLNSLVCLQKRFITSSQRCIFNIILQKAGNTSLDFVSHRKIKRYALITSRRCYNYRLLLIYSDGCLQITRFAWLIGQVYSLYTNIHAQCIFLQIR